MNESRIVKTQKNAISAVAQTVLNSVLSFLARIIFVSILSVDYLGINGLFTNILSVLSLADLGMQTAMMYSLYKPIADKDENKIRDLVCYFRRIYFVIALVIFIAGIAIIPFLKFIINLDNEIPHLIAYYILALLNIVISYLFVYRTTLVFADQKNYILNKYVMVFKVINFAAQTVILFSFKNYFFYLVVALIVSFLGNVYQNKVTLELYPFLKEKGRQLSEADKSKIIIDIKALFLYRISGTIQSNTDNILISIFVGTVFVGYYSNYLIIITALISVLTLIFNSVKASIGNIIASDDTNLKQKEFYFWVLELVNFWMVAFCSISCICLFPDFINIFLGKEYKLSLGITIAIVMNFYTNYSRQVIWTFRETTGLFHETRFITTVTAVLNIIFSLAAGYYFGMLGILVATVLARMIYAWWKEPIILFHNYFKKSAKQYYITYIRRFVVLVITAILTFGLGEIFEMYNIYIRFGWKIVLCCIVPNLTFGIYFKKTDELKYILDKIVIPMVRKVKSVVEGRIH